MSNGGQFAAFNNALRLVFKSSEKLEKTTFMARKKIPKKDAGTAHVIVSSVAASVATTLQSCTQEVMR